MNMGTGAEYALPVAIEAAKRINKHCLQKKDVVKDMVVYGTVGAVAGLLTGGVLGAVVDGAAGAMAPCAVALFSDDETEEDSD